jgi:hypothetical protein
MAARKKQTPRTTQRLFKFADQVSDINKQGSLRDGTPRVSEMGAAERTARSFFFDLPLTGVFTSLAESTGADKMPLGAGEDSNRYTW